MLYRAIRLVNSNAVDSSQNQQLLCEDNAALRPAVGSGIDALKVNPDCNQVRHTGYGLHGLSI